MNEYTSNASNATNEFATSMDFETSYKDSFLKYYDEAAELANE